MSDLVSGKYAQFNPSWLNNGSPSTFLKDNFNRLFSSSNAAALTTQVMLSTPVHLDAGDIVTNITFMSGGTAAGTPTNWWFALYSNAATPALLAQSADQTTTAWAANTAKTLALATAQTITSPGLYWAAVMVKATTVPTLAGITLQNAASSTGAVSGQVVLAQTSGSSLTTTAPATITSGTAVATVPYVVLT